MHHKTGISNRNESLRNRCSDFLQWTWGPAVLIAVFLLSVHLPRIQMRGSSHDEDGALRIAARSVFRIVTEYEEAQNHPFFSILAHTAITTLPVRDLLAARLTAFVAGVLFLVLFYQFCRTRLGIEAALAATFLLIIADPLHHYLTAARGYSLMVMGTLLMNECLLRYIRHGHRKWWVGYVVTAAFSLYTHLWVLPVVFSHACFVFREMICEEDCNYPRMGLLLSGIAFAGLCAFFLYFPMIEEIRRMGSERYVSWWGSVRVLADTVLQLARFRNWTLGVYVFLFPIFVSGVVRKLQNSDRSIEMRLHVTIVVAVLVMAWLLSPINFGCRYLVCIIPSFAYFFAWGMSGHKNGLTTSGQDMVSRLTFWSMALAIGIMVTNASMSANIPNSGIHVDAIGRDHGYFYRNLSQVMGSQFAMVLFLVSLVTALFNWKWKNRPRWCSTRSEWLLIWGSVVFLVISLPPLALGPEFFKPDWFFELHILAVGMTGLFFWEFHTDVRMEKVLSWSMVASFFIVLIWQLGGDQFHITSSVEWLRVVSPFPAAIVAMAFMKRPASEAL